MLQRYARPLEIALGVLFIVSAASKALDVYGFAVQIGAYGIIRDPVLLPKIAYAMIALEAALGAALLGGWSFGGATILATAALLVAFTGLIAYAWAFKGLADCGCFGSYVKMGPGSSIAKNIVLLAMTALVWYGQRKKIPVEISVDETTPTLATAKRNATRRSVLTALGLIVVVGAFAMGKPAPVKSSTTPVAPPKQNGVAPASKFADFVPEIGGAPVPLNQGEYLLAVLSASCDHCRAVTASLNDLSLTFQGKPQVAAIVMGNEDEIQDFLSATSSEFPIQKVDTLTGLGLLADDVQAPPDFYILRDGAIVRHLAAQEPSYDELLAFAQGADAPAANGQK